MRISVVRATVHEFWNEAECRCILHALLSVGLVSFPRLVISNLVGSNTLNLTPGAMDKTSTALGKQYDDRFPERWDRHI